MHRNLQYFCISFIIFCLFISCGNNTNSVKSTDSTLVQYPEKGNMIQLTDRPPQLETPLEIFKRDITPNEYFFVRWHLSQLNTKIDIDTFRLYVEGAVDKPLALSMNDLKTKFKTDSLIALAICAGNSRSTFNPRVPGAQWKNGAMGNAKWKGVKVKDILAMAGLKKGALDVTFQGMDRAPQSGIPPFIKSLRIDKAMEDEVLIAYEMNGEPIPMLNGYPLKLVVPGWYATYWVGSLNMINVLTDTFKGYWMSTAYKAPPNSNFSESPDSLDKHPVPLTKINLHSIFVLPEPTENVTIGKNCLVEGLAFNDGTGIQKVELSFDNGTTWVETKLNPEIAKYSWRRWKYDWVPKKTGDYHILLRATDKSGNTQSNKQWNRSGYAREFMERLDISVK
jgi:sulfite dehydrogenase